MIQNYGKIPSYVTVKYVYLSAIVGNLPTSMTIRRVAVDVDDYDGMSTARGLVFHRMFVNGSCNVWLLRTTEGAIVEYSASQNASGNGANHGEVVNLFYSGNNAIIRHNKFRNHYLNGGGTAIVAIVDADGLQCYGNTFSNFQVGDAVVGFGGNQNTNGTSHNRFYNNTIVGAKAAAGLAWDETHGGTDNIAWNNLWVDNPNVWFEGTHDYNAFSGTNAHGEANAQTNVTTAIFVNAAAGDYRLSAATLPGQALSAPYAVDMLGNAREAASWDRGAYEFVTNAPLVPPAAPTGLQVQ